MKLAIINEKPSQMRNFATALGGQSGVYDGVEYELCSLVGHIVEFNQPEDMVSKAQSAQMKSWDLTNLPWNEKDFDWSYRLRGNVKNVISNLTNVLKRCDTWVIAADDDPSGEGQLLAWEAIAATNLSYPPNGVWRMYFEDESPASIQKAFKERKPLKAMEYDPEYKKAFYRARWDFLSMQFTRIATKLSGSDMVLRNGRLKSAMVLIVGNQLEAVKNYVKKPFFQNRFKDENGVVYTYADEPAFDHANDVPSTYSDSDVVCDSKTMKHTAPPKLIDLSTLASRLAPKGYKATQITSIYQEMYQNQYVSYPRTEDKCVTQEQFNELLPKIDDICCLIDVDPAIVTHRVARKTHVKSGMAHGANRPGKRVPKSLDWLDSKFGKGAGAIYELLARSYIMMLCEDYEYEQQKGHVKDYPNFVGSVNVPKKLGWKAVDAGAVDPDDDESTTGLGTVASPFVYEGANPKPQAPTMKWLMTQLAKYDIGTGATRTSTYADVTNSKTKYPLLKDTRGKITFAKCGEMAYLLLPNTHIGDLELTRRVQEQMKGIAAGTMDADECLHEIQDLVREDITTMSINAEAMRKRLGITANATPSETASGVWNGRDVTFKRTFSGHRFTDEEVEKLLAGETISVTDFVSSKTGSKFAGAGKLEVQSYKGRKYLGFKIVEFLNLDGSKQAERNDADYASGTWKRKKVRFKRNFRGHILSDSEVEKLLSGSEIEIRGLKAKSGKEYGVKAKLANLTYNGHKYVGVEQVAFL